MPRLDQPARRVDLDEFSLQHIGLASRDTGGAPPPADPKSARAADPAVRAAALSCCGDPTRYPWRPDEVERATDVVVAALLVLD